MRSIASGFLVLVLCACDASDNVPPPSATPAAAENAIAKTSESGPIKATVTVSPKEPTIGDPIALSLVVEAERGVDVELPKFGEALGRFAVLDFTPRNETTPDGKKIATQTYHLQVPMSGKQRIPPLRIEFVDARAGNAPDAGRPEPRELLTEAIGIDVASTLPPDKESQVLRDAKARLPETYGAQLAIRYIPFGILFVAAVAAVFAWRTWKARRAVRIRISAYDAAIARLAALANAGFPSADQADAWYVELSNVVRRYLEDRFGVRAPELTTEEFLREARRSKELGNEHRHLLSSFLEGCDRVKFAAYKPDEAESRAALGAARAFLDETRIREDGAAASPATNSAAGSAA